MLPYGKDNWHRNADVAHGEWLASRGFAFCRLDVRGTGSSPGVALDEYTEAETLDGYDAVEWLAAQPWCNGNVGMWGISYGGFTSIQVAKLRPPHLRAILPMYATDDRYRDDVHVRGGCVTASEKSQYAVSQLGMNAMPPLPAVPRCRLARRVARAARGDAALAVSLDPRADRRTLLAAGLAGARLRRARVRGVPGRRLERRVRRPGVPDPGAVHATRRGGRSSATGSTRTPTTPTRGPNLDWLHEVVRFFDRYLKDVDNGWDARARADLVRARRGPIRSRSRRTWPGRWRAADAFPVPGTVPLELDLDRDERTGEAILRAGGRPGDPDGKPTDGRCDRIAHRATVGHRAARCPGAPAGPPTAWPATSGPTSAEA